MLPIWWATGPGSRDPKEHGDPGFVDQAAACVLFFFFQLDDHDFDGVGAAVDVGVGRVGWVGGKPVGFSDFPVVDFGGASGVTIFIVPPRRGMMTRG